MKEQIPTPLSENKIKEICCSMGAYEVGFSHIKGFVPAPYEALEYAVTVVYRLSDAVVDAITDRPTKLYFHHYRSVNFCLDQISLRVVTLLQDAGFQAIAVPASQTEDKDDRIGLFSHKIAATSAGLGYVGKSNLFIMDKIGPRLRLATILTNHPFHCGTPVTESKCGSCLICMKSCPARAIEGNLWHRGIARSEILDAFSCGEYMSTHFKKIGRGSVCGICMKVCPKREK